MTPRPFNWVSREARGKVLLCLTILVVGVSAWLFWMDRALVTEGAPNGIVTFELARSLQQSSAILSSWSEQARAIAMLIQGVDYLYLFLYPAWFSLASQLLSGMHAGVLQSVGAATSWLILLAIPLDAIENYALIQQLLHGASSAQAQLAFWCAVPKFALVAGAAVYVLLACVVWLARRKPASG